MDRQRLEIAVQLEENIKCIEHRISLVGMLKHTIKAGQPIFIKSDVSISLPLKPYHAEKFLSIIEEDLKLDLEQLNKDFYNL